MKYFFGKGIRQGNYAHVQHEVDQLRKQYGGTKYRKKHTQKSRVPNWPISCRAAVHGIPGAACYAYAALLEPHEIVHLINSNEPYPKKSQHHACQEASGDEIRMLYQFA